VQTAKPPTSRPPLSTLRSLCQLKVRMPTATRPCASRSAARLQEVAQTRASTCNRRAETSSRSLDHATFAGGSDSRGRRRPRGARSKKEVGKTPRPRASTLHRRPRPQVGPSNMQPSQAAPIREVDAGTAARYQGRSREVAQIKASTRHRRAEPTSSTLGRATVAGNVASRGRRSHLCAGVAREAATPQRPPKTRQNRPPPIQTTK
jgi:hypothetical protein